jgi:DNA-binding transcriptional LysR family regulator
MRKTTNLDDINIFVAVAEAGTFSAAATHLRLPASTISRSLTRLEKNMDLLLVRRSQRGLALTAPEAEAVYAPLGLPFSALALVSGTTTRGSHEKEKSHMIAATTVTSSVGRTDESIFA